MVVQRFTNLGLTGRGGQSETEEDEEEGEKGEQGDVISDNLGHIGRWEGGGGRQGWSPAISKVGIVLTSVGTTP